MQEEDMLFIYGALVALAIAVALGAAEKYGFKMSAIKIEEKYYKHILIGVSALIGLIVLGVLVSHSTLGASFWVPAFTVISLAVFGIMGKAGGIGQLAGWVVGLTLLGYLGLHALYGEHFNEVVTTWQESAVSQAKGESPSATARVVGQKLTITKGTLVVPLQRRCFVDSINEKMMSDFGITSKYDMGRAVLIYTSTSPKNVVGKVWFFDEGGDCDQDLEKLREEKAFL